MQPFVLHLYGAFHRTSSLFLLLWTNDVLSTQHCAVQDVQMVETDLASNLV